MRSTPSNPEGNVLPSGIEERLLVEGITESGFPLQGSVAEELVQDYLVIEEWGFIDDETQSHRTLDIYAHRDLGESTGQVSPGLVLLMECKRSRNPFVFFRTQGIREISSFPAVSGLHSPHITISERGRGRSTTRSPAEVLRLDELPFIAQAPPVCGAFSQAVRAKKRVELSGADPFNRVILPLVKAIRHKQAALTLSTNQALVFPTLVLAVCVLDAAMVLVEEPTRAADPVLTPWIRVARREAMKDRDGRFRNRFFAIDFVHVAFLREFVREHVQALSDEFARRAIAAGDCLRHGASVPNLSGWEFEDLKPLRSAR